MRKELGRIREREREKIAWRKEEGEEQSGLRTKKIEETTNDKPANGEVEFSSRCRDSAGLVCLLLVLFTFYCLTLENDRHDVPTAGVPFPKTAKLKANSCREPNLITGRLTS